MKSAALRVLRVYKRWVSPLLMPSCRYVPSCSEYAAEAVEIHGPVKGALLTAWRLLRCQPLARGGYDPVPRCDCDYEHGGMNSAAAQTRK